MLIEQLTEDQCRFASAMWFQARAQGFGDRPGIESEVTELTALAGEDRQRANRAARAWFCGDSATEAVAASQLPAFESYLRLRRDGTGAATAYAEAAAMHAHHWSTEVSDQRDRVLGTGRVVTTRSCACGARDESVAYHRWSGD